MLFAYHCGMRLGEAYAVTWDNVDFEDKTITINKQLQWDEEQKFWYLTPPKYNSVRTIGIDQFVLDLLRTVKDGRNAQKRTMPSITRRSGIMRMKVSMNMTARSSDS